MGSKPRLDRRELGKYELIARIGEGGMAAVHLARQRGPMNFQKLVVIKTVHPTLAQQPELVEMLLDEARIAALVKHPNVVDIYDLGRADGTYFIAMEYLDGEPLSAIIRAGRAGRPLDPFSTARLIADCADGLAAAHNLQSLSGERLDLVHHDVTPANIIVLYTGQVKLVDFGVAKAGIKARDEAERDRLGGKIGYLAPEQLRREPVDRRRDIFALGVVLWEALTMRRLFYAESDVVTAQQILRQVIPPPSTLSANVPRELDDICFRALARDPAERYQDASELSSDLEAFLYQSNYSGKNEPIARYMQATFADRIVARQELLREIVSDDGMPSEDTISIVFDVPSESPPTPVPITGSHGRASSPSRPGLVARLPEASASSRSGSSSRPPASSASSRSGSSSRPPASASRPPATAVAIDDDEVTPPVVDITVIDDANPNRLPLPAPVEVAEDEAEIEFLRRPSETEDYGAMALESDEGVPARPRRRRALIAALVAGVAVVAGLVFAFGRGRTSAPRGTPASPAVALAVSDAPGADERAAGAEPPVAVPAPVAEADAAIAAAIDGDEVPPPDEPEEPAAPEDSENPEEPAEVVAAPEPSKSERRSSRHRRRTATAPEPDPEPGSTAAATPRTLYKQGLQLFVAGKVDEAMKKFEAARKLDPGYAPAYRGLGMVHERRGNTRRATEAYRTYLKLAPDGKDAAAIRSRLKGTR